MNTQDIKSEIKFFDKIADKYDHYDTISEKDYKQILDKIIPYLGNNILDAGCATGDFAKRIKKIKANIKISGIDLNKKFIKFATATGVYNKAICGNIEKENIFKKSEFDTIVCLNLLHHFPDIKYVINNCYHWLKPNGYLIIADPNGSNLILKISYFIRLFIRKFVRDNNCASPNESHKTVGTFIKALSDFEIKKIDSLEDNLPHPIKFLPFSLMNTLVYTRKKLLDFYKKLPFIKYGGCGLLIVARKNQIS
ncbi:methyltransferase [Candidatus Roizmanbacteria bacterium]|nr:methyltransferase [Candidatus Roizmanbacteria bacterium]